MTRYDVIESRRWKRDDGRTASIYGAVPWVSDAERGRWAIESVGFTVRDNQRGTVGIGRAPWPTREEAEAWVSRMA
jgi:hypothetical protein